MTDFRAVFRKIPALLRQELPPALHDFEWRASSSMAKAWYGNKTLHYEIWVRPSLKVVELGLHFECDPLTNARLGGAFRARSKQIVRALGRGTRIEEWDRGWSRVWEQFPLASLDEDALARRFVAYVRALEPILREELPNDVAWTIRKPRRAARGSASRGSRSAR